MSNLLFLLWLLKTELTVLPTNGPKSFVLNLLDFLFLNGKLQTLVCGGSQVRAYHYTLLLTYNYSHKQHEFSVRLGSSNLRALYQ